MKKKHLAISLLLGTHVACTITVDPEDSGVFPCGSEADCIDGFICVSVDGTPYLDQEVREGTCKSQDDPVINNQNNKFWLKHSLDTRGRTYCNGYLINYQGASYKKAIVQLHDKEVVRL